MPYKVFISAARRDIDLARDLAERLGKAGVAVTLPVPISDTGDDVAAKIDSDLRKADEVIVILTPNSLDSKWLLFEMGVATSLEKKLTPLVQGVEPKELPPIIKQMDYVKYADLERYISKLKQRVNSLSAPTR
jgi:nucleoside 2-deoxyribosyltransferase